MGSASEFEEAPSICLQLCAGPRLLAQRQNENPLLPSSWEYREALQTTTFSTSPIDRRRRLRVSCHGSSGSNPLERGTSTTN